MVSYQLIDEKLILYFSQLNIAPNITSIQELRDNWNSCDTYESVANALEAINVGGDSHKNSSYTLTTSPNSDDLSEDFGEVDLLLQEYVPVPRDIAYNAYILLI